MTKHRVDRVGKEIQKEIADILSQEIKDPRLGFVSVIAVDTAPDLSFAKVHISSFSDNHKEVLSALNSARGFIRHLLGQRLKLRIVPELSFVLDDSIAYGIRMSEIIDKQIKEDENAANEAKNNEETSREG